jgi:hypothetical protein
VPSDDHSKQLIKFAGSEQETQLASVDQHRPIHKMMHFPTVSLNGLLTGAGIVLPASDVLAR